VDGKLLGARIKQARERLQMSQEQLGEIVSRDQRAISEYENGKRRIAAIDLPLFAHALQVPLLYFYEGEQLSSSDQYQLFFEEFQQLPSLEAQRTAMELVRAFANYLKLSSE
jgi:transcriptional regulator with XRE-family HTH domain